MSEVQKLIDTLQETVGPKNTIRWMTKYATPFLIAINNNQNPFPWAVKAAHDSIYPQMPPSFTRQLWWLVALFTISMTIALVGLNLRLLQGRFWLVHRMDSRITMPNISIQNSFWAFLYSLMSIIELVITSRIVSGLVYPTWYIGYQGFLPVIVFLGQYTEIWATGSAWCLRKYGPHTHDSSLISACFTAIPFLWPIVAVSPPIVFFSLAARALSGVHGGVGVCIVNLEAFESSWTSGTTMDDDLAQLIQGLKPLGIIAAYAKTYALWSRVAFRYIGGILVITFILYMTATVVEFSHLRRQVRNLRRKAGLEMAMPPKRISLFTGNMESEPSSASTLQFVQAGLSNNDSLNIQLEQQSRLMAWATSNRLLTAVPVLLMLSANAALAFWSSVTPITLSENDGNIQIIALVAAWINSMCSTVVAILILFRALSGSPKMTEAVKRYAPWLPLAPVSTTSSGVINLAAFQSLHLPQGSVKADPTSLKAHGSGVSEDSGAGGSEKVTITQLHSGVTGITIERHQRVCIDSA